MFVTLLSSKHVEDNSVTNILLMNKENCALKLVEEIILYYDARSKKHQIVDKTKVRLNKTRITSTLHEDQYIILVISCSLLLRMKKCFRQTL